VKTTTTTGVIADVQRIPRNSANGNPRYRLILTDGRLLTTGVDSSVAYEITNPEYRGGPVEFGLNARGDVVDARPIAR
jgi:hypothetical protein